MPTDAQGLWDGLIDDAAMFPPGNAPLPEAIAAHHDHRRAAYAPLVGPLLCSDRNLRALGETVADAVDIGLIVTGGAGAIGPGVQHASTNAYVSVVSVEIALRDEDDLARNAERIVRMLEIELPEAATASVEVPRTYDREPTGSWWEALDEIAAMGHRLKFRTGGEHPDAHPSERELATFVNAALDRECAFKLTAGLHHAVRNTDAEHGYEQHGFCNVLLATRALLDGAGVDDAAQILARRDAGIGDELRAWDAATAASTRRWFTSLGSCSIAEPVADLNQLGLIFMTWVPGAAGSLYDADNLPYGVISRAEERPRVAVRIGDYALDVAPVAALGGDPGDGPHLAEVWSATTLNPFLALGREAWRIAREWLVEILTDDVHRARVEPHLHPLSELTAHLPIEIGDYVDFYASIDHATNLGRILRPDSPPLLPNWRHLPVGYHGRSGTVVASGTQVVRPLGQRKAPSDDAPSFGPTQRLDIEAELGFVVGTASTHGDRVRTDEFADHVFGAFLLNDWSARDIQGWEGQPLGPHLAKSFATSVAAWITPLEALEAARVDLPTQDPAPLDYLRTGKRAGYDIDLAVEWNGTTVARPPYAAMYWSPAQMLAHLTVNGASVRTGDVYASGTISGPEPDQLGSFVELSRAGTKPVTLADGTTRTFLEDGDEVVLTATAPSTTGGRIGLAEVRGTIAAARGL